MGLRQFVAQRHARLSNRCGRGVRNLQFAQLQNRKLLIVDEQHLLADRRLASVFRLRATR